MLGNLIRRGGKVRFACAAAGVAVAAGAVVFMFSLTATNRAQAPALAARAAAPWAAWRFDWPMGPRGGFKESKFIKESKGFKVPSRYMVLDWTATASNYLGISVLNEGLMSKGEAKKRIIFLLTHECLTTAGLWKRMKQPLGDDLTFV